MVEDLNSVIDEKFIKENDINSLGKLVLEQPVRIDADPKQLPQIAYDPIFGQTLASIKDPKLSKDINDILNEAEFDIQANNTQAAYEKILKMLNRLENYK